MSTLPLWVRWSCLLAFLVVVVLFFLHKGTDWDDYEEGQ